MASTHPSKSEWARKQAERFEASDGARGERPPRPAIIVLTTVGAKTGKLRKTALMRVEHEGDYAVVASKGGAAKHPGWVYNLRANPHVELQDGAEKLDYRARRGQRRGEGRVVGPGPRGLARLRRLPEADRPRRSRSSSWSHAAKLTVGPAAAADPKAGAAAPSSVATRGWRPSRASRKSASISPTRSSLSGAPSRWPPATRRLPCPIGPSPGRAASR